MATPKILIIYTGGTIGMGKDPVTGVLEPLDFNHLVSSMPEFKLIQAEIDVRKFDPPIDSSDMDPMRWAEIVSMIANNYNDYDGFVILHGTDTMHGAVLRASGSANMLSTGMSGICSLTMLMYFSFVTTHMFSTGQIGFNLSTVNCMRERPTPITSMNCFG